MNIKLYATLNIIVLFLIVIAGCSIANLPRDEIELYEQGVMFWEAGYYEMAIKSLTPFIIKDSLYMPVYALLADSYYNIGNQEQAHAIINRAFNIGSQSEIIENLKYSFDAEQYRRFEYQERVGFAQYLEDTAARFALDKGLLYALIQEGSSFHINGVNNRLGKGIMGLSREQAEKIGLKVPDTEGISTIAIYEEDERFDAAKTIYYSSERIAGLLDNYRFGNKSTDLTKALNSFYQHVNDSLFVSNFSINRVINYYQLFRHNIDKQEEANSIFYQQNASAPFVYSRSGVIDSPDYRQLEAYLESKLINYMPVSFPDSPPINSFLSSETPPKAGICQSSYYNNLALISEMFGKNVEAEQMYLNALQILPDSENVILNYAIFLFEQGRFLDSYDILKHLRSDKVDIIRSYCLLLLNRHEELSALLNNQPVTNNHHLLNIKGLLLFQTGQAYNSLDYFYNAFTLSNNPIFAANYLAAYHHLIFPETSYSELTSLNKITRSYDTGFIWPVEMKAVSSGFGWRPSPFRRTWRERLENLDFHNGIDIPGTTGTPVKASASGEVIISKSFPLGGETVFIQHQDNYVTTYLHLDKRFVEEGESVKQGQIIGLLGNTGQSTGAHLHFGMFNNRNQPTNPLSYLPVY